MLLLWLLLLLLVVPLQLLLRLPRVALVGMLNMLLAPECLPVVPPPHSLLCLLLQQMLLLQRLFVQAQLLPLMLLLRL